MKPNLRGGSVYGNKHRRLALLNSLEQFRVVAVSSIQLRQGFAEF
jgi:hypothetical protein